jgi:protoporphyrin/coproporphyrin ferrochelatase
VAETAVLLMAYGSPGSPDEVEAYYTHIRRGRPPEPEQLADLVGRYEALGGVSRLRERTEAQAAAIQETLDDARPGHFEVRLGLKHAAPFIEDTAAALADDGFERVVGAVLAPHYSAGSVGQYLTRAADVCGQRRVSFGAVEQWYDLEAYRDFLAASVRSRLAELPDATKVLFTAHSLPLRVLEGDPYPDQLEAGARAIAEAAGLAPFDQWGRCWQSAGRTQEPWAGPDILEVIAELAATGRADAVLVCPHGFVADHLEVAYDLDLEARAAATGAGLAFERTAVVNDDAEVMGALAARIGDVADTATAWTPAGAIS